jgi:hypothetical protein
MGENGLELGIRHDWVGEKAHELLKNTAKKLALATLRERNFARDPAGRSTPKGPIASYCL